MPKPKVALHVRLPPYVSPRLRWRRQVYEAIRLQAEKSRVANTEHTHLALEVRLCFTPRAVGWHDVDNRLKDVMDALQGRLGGRSSRRMPDAAIPNGNPIYQVTLKKLMAPPQSHLRGHLQVTRVRR